MQCEMPNPSGVGEARQQYESQERRIAKLYTVSKALQHKGWSLRFLAQMVLDAAVELSEAECGVLVMFDCFWSTVQTRDRPVKGTRAYSRVRNALSASAAKTCKSWRWRRSTASIMAVEQLPARIQITFGGWPKRSFADENRRLSSRWSTHAVRHTARRRRRSHPSSRHPARAESPDIRVVVL